jgi:hypothetical protein
VDGRIVLAFVGGTTVAILRPQAPFDDVVTGPESLTRRPAPSDVG